MNIAGVDVSSRRLDIYSEKGTASIANSSSAITRWLSLQERDLVVGIEATGGYGLLFADLAHEAGITVYILCPRWVAGYRKSAGVRAKNDRIDAKLIQEYVAQHHRRLHPYEPLKEPYRTLQELARQRLRLARDLDRIKKRDIGVNAAPLEAAFRQVLNELTTKIEGLLADIPEAEGLLELAGVGPLLTAASLSAFATHPFQSKDAFVAFCGLDLAVHESGTRKGRRYITCRGDSTLRCLLFLAGKTQSRMPQFQDRYAYLRQEKHLSATEAWLVMGRQTARRIYGVLHPT